MPVAIRIKFGNAIRTELLVRMHNTPSSPPPEIEAIFLKAGCTGLKPVHILREQEITDDAYGFSREFTVLAINEDNAEQAVKTLSGSDYFESAQLIRLIRQS